MQGLFPSSPLPQYADYVSGGVSSGRGNLPWAGVGARVSNMAANIGLFLYHLPDDTWHLLVSHSEKNMRFPVCPDSDLCPYHTVKQYYREKVFPAAGFGLCSQHDWSLACNGTVPCDVD